MDLNVWTVGQCAIARVVDGRARLEVQLEQGEGSEEVLGQITRELWLTLQEHRTFLRGENRDSGEGCDSGPPPEVVS